MSLVSCLPVPLGDPEKSVVDPKLTGVWESKEENGGTLIAIAPADSHVYVVQMLGYKKSGDELTVANHTTLRAWLTDIKTERFLTAEMLSQMVDLKATEKGYGTFRLRTKAEGIEVTPLKETFEGFKDVKDAAALAKVVADHLADPAMYAEPSIFRRLNPDKAEDKALIGLTDK